MTAPVEVWGIGTARTIRVHWMLHELDVLHKVHPVQSRTGETQEAEFLAINPRGKIPVLRHGDLVLAESAAIVSYLADHWGKGRQLIPPPMTRERALYDQWAYFVLSELDAHTLYVLRRHGDLANLYGEAPAALVAAREYFQRQVQVALEEIRAKGPYLLGENFSAADILLTSCLDWAVFYGEPLDPVLIAYQALTHQRASFGAAMAANFPPAVMEDLKRQAGR